MNRKLWYKTITQDGRGEILSKEERPARSFLGLWNRLIWAQMAQADVAPEISVLDINGDAFLYSKGTSGWNLRMNADPGITNYGIVIGTGNTPVDISDYKLEAQVLNDDMNHLVTVINEPVVADPNCDFLVSRQFINASGWLITVKESGIYVWLDQTPSVYAFGCVVRDVFTIPQDVPVGGGITVEYTLRVSE